MNNTAALAALGVVGVGGLLLWQSQRGASVNELVNNTLASLNAATSRASAIASTPPAARGQVSAGATTAPLPREVLLNVINAPVEEGQIRPVANLATGNAYQPVITGGGEVLFAGAAGDDWVMRNGQWVRV